MFDEEPSQNHAREIQESYISDVNIITLFATKLQNLILKLFGL